PQVIGAGRVTPLGSPPPPQPIPAGQTRTFAWTYVAAQPGDVAFGCSGSGTDALSGATVAVSTSWPKVLLQTPAALSSAVTVAAALSVGDQGTLQLDVTNGGDSLAAAVLPSLTIAGSGIAVLSAPGPQDVP